MCSCGPTSWSSRCVGGDRAAYSSTRCPDLFHDDVPDEYIARVFAVMALASPHTFQVLTKRHARMRALLSSEAFERHVRTEARRLKSQEWAAREYSRGRKSEEASRWEFPGWPLPNVWVGVSAENQQWADIRIPVLRDTPAAARFVSAEPLLGPIDLRRHLQCFHCKTTHKFSVCDKSGRPIPYGPLSRRHI